MELFLKFAKKFAKIVVKTPKVQTWLYMNFTFYLYPFSRKENRKYKIPGVNVELKLIKKSRECYNTNGSVCVIYVI